MIRTAATLVATAGLLAGPVGQASATGSWTEEPVPASAESGSLTAAGSAQGESWAFGYTSKSEGPEGGKGAIFRKDAQGWQQVPIDTVGSLTDGAVIAPGDIWTISLPSVGGPGASAHWDGQQWTRVDLAAPHGEHPHPQALKAFAPDDVWTVGRTGTTSGMAQHWDGKAWTDVPVPQIDDGLYTLEDVEGVAPNDMWAVGQATSTSRSIALHWDGNAWTEVPTPDVNGEPGVPEGLTNVLALAADDVWVGGYSGEADYEVPYTAHWDGTAWNVFEFGETGKVSQFLQVGGQLQLFGVGPTREPFWFGWGNGRWEVKLAPPMVRVYGAVVQGDGTILGVGDRTGEGARLEPYTATYHE